MITDGRFSGGSSGLSIGHVSPEAAEGGAIGLVEDGDTIQIDIPNRTIHLDVDDATMAHRRTAQEAKGWHPAEERKRKVSKIFEDLCFAFNQCCKRCGTRSVNYL